jgi:hypothetical protein
MIMLGLRRAVVPLIRADKVNLKTKKPPFGGIES